MTAEKGDRKRKRLLKSVFGFDRFRPFQEEIVNAICNKNDVFAVMPTGGGKSLCYQFPAVLLDGVCVVISPLLSLMKDQVDSACETGIRAATINSTTSAAAYGAAMGAMERSELDLLYISPERFNSPNFQERLGRMAISFFAVDEAHCISEWGHQFRPDYLELGRIADLFPDVPIAAFTATATERVARDIKNRLRLRTPFLVRASFNRPNLDYSVVRKDDLKKQLMKFLNTMPNEPGIIYRGTRKNVEETAAMLKKEGFSVYPYHAGMSAEERNRVQENFTYDRVQVIVATIAFGMGIDKPNVRFVVHADLPKNIEGYYQETGRAGRDGAPAKCLLLFGYQDVVLQQSFIEKYEDPAVRRIAREQLDQMIKYAESDQCRRKAILGYFGEEYSEENCGHCDYCRGAIKRADATVDAQKALSAMYRTGNRFGIGHLSDILVGKATPRVKEFGHDQLPTFGVGRDRTKFYWRFLINALVCRGIAAMKPDCDYPIPQVTPLGIRVMKGQETFSIIEFLANAKQEKRERKRKQDSRIVDPKDQDLFEMLRIRRKEIASERNVPPYVVFTDQTLIDIAARKPLTPEELLEISGVGNRKVEQYGDDILELIEDYIRSSPEPE